MTVPAAVKTFVSAVRAASRPVWVFLAVETAIVAAVSTLVALRVHGLTAAVDLHRFPPWPTLAVFAPLCFAVRTRRLAHVGQAARHWHGVLVRRVDQRWAADHDELSTQATTNEPADARRSRSGIEAAGK